MFCIPITYDFDLEDHCQCADWTDILSKQIYMISFTNTWTHITIAMSPPKVNHTRHLADNMHQY